MKIVLKKELMKEINVMVCDLKKELEEQGIEVKQDMPDVYDLFKDLEETTTHKFNVIRGTVTVDIKDTFLLDVMGLYMKYFNKFLPVARRMMDIIEMCKPIVQEAKEDIENFSKKYD